MLKRYPRSLEIHCTRSGCPRGIKSHLTRSLVAYEGWSTGRWSGTAQTENAVRHTKYGRIRGMVVGEGGRSTGVLLYLDSKLTYVTLLYTKSHQLCYNVICSLNYLVINENKNSR